MNPQRYLAAALFALSALYVAWFARDAHALAGLLVFALPPALLAVSALAGWRRAGFTSAVIALLWFFTGLTFGSVQIGTAVMLQDGRDDAPRGGRRQRPPAVPLPARAAARAPR